MFLPPPTVTSSIYNKHGESNGHHQFPRAQPSHHMGPVHLGEHPPGTEWVHQAVFHREIVVSSYVSHFRTIITRTCEGFRFLPPLTVASSII